MNMMNVLLYGSLLVFVVISVYEFISRKQLQNRLDATQEQLALITDQLQALVAYVDTQHRYIYVNKRYAEWYGFSKEDMLGKAVQETVAPEAYSRARPLHEAALRGEHISFENVAPGPDGQKHHIWVDLVPHTDQNGNVKGFLGLILDISELKHKEEELRQAKEIAETANQAKSVFLANMSHELRTPLNSILGFTQLIARSHHLSLEDWEHLSIIRRSGEHLLTLINQVLDLSKVEAGRLTLEPKPLDLYRLLEEVEDMFMLKATSKNLRIDFHRTPQVPHYIRADEVKLRQVLINLIGNAIKFTEKGSVNVQVRSEHFSAPERAEALTTNLQISISDTGPGMTQEEVKTIFDAFVQTESGKQSYEGTGLGLTISRTFVRLIGGEISVKSEPGQGSVFIFTIPVEILTSVPHEFQTVAHRVIGLEPGQPSYRVLIVDDDQYNRKLLVRLLSFSGFEMREAQNGQEALEIWKQWEPHLILMDLRMPVMEGYEATQTIRELEQLNARPPVPIIALSASSIEDEHAVALEKGCNDFLRKPFREEDLFAILQAQLGIRYVYQTEIMSDFSGHISEGSLRSALGELPTELANQLYAVTLMADMQRIFTCIDDIRQSNAELAVWLTHLVKNFEYGKILEALDKDKQGNKEPQ